MSKHKKRKVRIYKYRVGTLSIAFRENQFFQCPLNILLEYKERPFKPHSEKKLQFLASDIRINGVLSPIIIRPFEDGKYQILDGHNRVRASKIAGMDKIPAIVKEVDDDIAKLIVVSTNLYQRDKLTYREKAYANKMQLEVLRKLCYQGIVPGGLKNEKE